jgi:small subunit ribosomal protein S20
MPIIKSAKKRVKVARKATVRNVKTKRNLRTAIKDFHAAVTGKSKKAPEAQSKAQSAIDTAVKKGVMNKNKAARKKSQLANELLLPTSSKSNQKRLRQTKKQ